MDTSWIIGIVVGAIVLVVAVVALVSVARKPPKEPDDPGRGPTGQSPDPREGTPSDTSTPHWDRRPEGREGPL